MNETPLSALNFLVVTRGVDERGSIIVASHTAASAGCAVKTYLRDGDRRLDLGRLDSCKVRVDIASRCARCSSVDFLES